MACLFVIFARMPKRGRTPEIADVVALVHALDHDEGQSPAEMAARERRFASEVPASATDPLRVGLTWLDFVSREDKSVGSIRQRAGVAVTLTDLVVVLAGIVLGWGATLGAVYFDGSGRVNTVSVLAVLVVVPGLFLLPFALAALPPNLGERVPGARILTALGGAMTAGRLATLLWRLFPGDLRESLSLLSGRLGKHHRLYAGLQKWTVLRWSQLFALTFQITALAATLSLVVFTDVAFGWSTTLSTGDPLLDARRVHRVTSTIAAPWRGTISDAAPSLQLIVESRYFRAAAVPLTPAEAALLGGWWRFVVLTIVVYGMIPRIVTYLLARSRMRAALRAAFIASPGLSAVLRRIHRARIESAAVEPEADWQGSAPAPSAGRPAPRAGHIAAIIQWAGAPLGPSVATTRFPGARHFAAGGATSVSEDLVCGREVGRTVESSDGDVLVVVKGWEPPMMDFLDFVASLRAALSREGTMIFILPVGLDPTAELSLATEQQIGIWRGKLATVSDPWLRVSTTIEEVLA